MIHSENGRCGKGARRNSTGGMGGGSIRLSGHTVRFRSMSMVLARENGKGGGDCLGDTAALMVWRVEKFCCSPAMLPLCCVQSGYATFSERIRQSAIRSPGCMLIYIYYRVLLSFKLKLTARSFVLFGRGAVVVHCSLLSHVCSNQPRTTLC